MWTRKFWKDAAERATRTFAQTAAAFITTAAAGNAIGVTDLSWQGMGSVSLLAAFYSLLMSVAASGAGDTSTASFLGKGD